MAPLFTGLRLGFGAGPSGPSVFSATGGTVTTYNGKTIHTFTSSGSFVINALGSGSFGAVIDLMVVGGGGGGGHNIAGGGGAGGMRVFTNVPVVTGTFPVTIGGGGSGSGDGSAGSSGQNSTFALTPFGPIVATGGG